MATKTLTVKEVAEKLGTDGKRLRKFLRSEVQESGGEVGVDTPGKGKRWVIEAKAVPGISKRFAAWQSAKPTKTDEPDETEEEDTDEVTDSDEVSELD